MFAHSYQFITHNYAITRYEMPLTEMSTRNIYWGVKAAGA
jgi:hypothetical protein